MDLLGATRLLDTGGGVVFLQIGPFAQQVLTWLLLWVLCLGVLHLGLSVLRRRLPVALFCLLGALSCAGVGLSVLWDMLREHGERSLLASVLWGPGFAVGLFVVGALGSAGWVVLTLGLARLLGRRDAGGPDEDTADESES
jgi:hypothetical protein